MLTKICLTTEVYLQVISFIHRNIRGELHSQIKYDTAISNSCLSYSLYPFYNYLICGVPKANLVPPYMLNMTLNDMKQCCFKSSYQIT